MRRAHARIHVEHDASWRAAAPSPRPSSLCGRLGRGDPQKLAETQTNDDGGFDLESAGKKPQTVDRCRSRRKAHKLPAANLDGAELFRAALDRIIESGLLAGMPDRRWAQFLTDAESFIRNFGASAVALGWSAD